MKSLLHGLGVSVHHRVCECMSVWASARVCMYSRWWVCVSVCVQSESFLIKNLSVVPMLHDLRCLLTRQLVSPDTSCLASVVGRSDSSKVVSFLRPGIVLLVWHLGFPSRQLRRPVFQHKYVANVGSGENKHQSVSSWVTQRCWPYQKVKRIGNIHQRNVWISRAPSHFIS